MLYDTVLEHYNFLFLAFWYLWLNSCTLIHGSSGVKGSLQLRGSRGTRMGEKEEKKLEDPIYDLEDTTRYHGSPLSD